jgi:hypothetical protein
LRFWVKYWKKTNDGFKRKAASEKPGAHGWS